MDVNAILEGVKKLVFGEAFVPAPAATPAPVAPIAPVAAAAAYTLIDGTAVDIDKLENGGVLKVNAMPAPAGTYTLSDNTVITVDANGVITDIQAAAPPATAAPGIPATVNTNPPGTNALFTMDQMKEMVQKFAIGGTDERVARLETLCSALMENVFGWELQNAERQSTAKAALEAYAGVEAAMSSAKTDAAQFKQAVSESVQGLFKVVEEIAKTPTSDPLNTPKDSFKSDKTQKKEDKMKAIAESFKKLKEEKNHN